MDLRLARDTAEFWLLSVACAILPFGTAMERPVSTALCLALGGLAGGGIGWIAEAARARIRRRGRWVAHFVVVPAVASIGGGALTAAWFASEQVARGLGGDLVEPVLILGLIGGPTMALHTTWFVWLTTRMREAQLSPWFLVIGGPLLVWPAAFFALVAFFSCACVLSPLLP